MDMSPHISQLKAAGCPDRSLVRIPDLFDTLLADTSLLLIDQKNGIPADEIEQLNSFKPQLIALCDELASYNIPETLHHDDLTSGNIALNKQGYVFFDWAESSITHPFCSMFILLRVAKYIHEFSEGELVRLRNIYLATWAHYQPIDHLLHAFELAQRLAMLCRSLTWYNVVKHTTEERSTIEDSVAYWLRLFWHNGNE
jgi:Phosphotransferase enzyme family